MRKTKIPSLSLVTCLLLPVAVFLASCGPTYPKERIVESLQALCETEYQTHVEAMIAATTIGVLLPVDGLFEGLDGTVSERDFEQVATRLPFSKSALEAIEKAARALSRVVLSTDAPLEFYTVVTRDIPTGVEFVWSGYITDLRRLNYMDISQGDFLRYRTPVSLRIQPEQVARRTVESFLKERSYRPAALLLSRYVAASAPLEKILSALFALRQEEMSRLDQAGLPDAPRSEKAFSSISVGPQEVLVHVTFKDPSVSSAYLFLVEVNELRGLIRQIDRLPDKKILPARVSSLGSPASWGGRFVVHPFSLPQFLADQIARRTRVNLTSVPGGLSPQEFNVGGFFEGRIFGFQFQINDLPDAPEEKKTPLRKAQPRDPEDLASAVVQEAAQVLHSYRFTDFEELTVTDAIQGTRWVVPAKDLILYRRRNPPPLKQLP